jgi:RNA polymerase sigma factor (sigma-70 family)
MSEHQDDRKLHQSIPSIALNHDQISRMEAALARLRSRDRAIFMASCQEHLTYAEIALRHRCSVGKVRRTIAHVLIKLHRAVCPRE